MRAATRIDPDLILYNSNILNVDAAGPRAQAVAIAGERYLAVGSNDDIRGISKPAEKRSFPDSSTRTRTLRTPVSATCAG